MKKLVYLFVSLFLVVVAAENVSAQDPQSATSDASANIISPMTISNSVALAFGNIAAGTSDGTVVLGVDGVRIPTNVILPSITGTVSAATFTVTGLDGSDYRLTLPTSVTITNGTDNMTIENFVSDADNVLTGGSEEFNVGATLNIEAGQAVGLYQGSYAVTVDYQ